LPIFIYLDTWIAINLKYQQKVRYSMPDYFLITKFLGFELHFIKCKWILTKFLLVFFFLCFGYCSAYVLCCWCDLDLDSLCWQFGESRVFYYLCMSSILSGPSNALLCFITFSSFTPDLIQLVVPIFLFNINNSQLNI
jgi:hypothetical protein